MAKASGTTAGMVTVIDSRARWSGVWILRVYRRTPVLWDDTAVATSITHVADYCPADLQRPSSSFVAALYNEFKSRGFTEAHIYLCFPVGPVRQNLMVHVDREKAIPCSS